MSEPSAPTEFSISSYVASHVKLYLEDPEKAHMWDTTPVGGPGVLPTLLLTTTGRKSGEPRMSPLLYVQVDAGYVIVASNSGAPQHPAWYLNLLKTPDSEIQVSTEHHHVKARVVEGEERATLWKKMTELYAPYDDYQVSTDREIPVAVLEPTN